MAKKVVTLKQGAGSKTTTAIYSGTRRQIVAQALAAQRTVALGSTVTTTGTFILVEDLGNSYRAPKPTVVQQGEIVTFVNDSGGDVSIQFARDGIFGRKGLRLKSGQMDSLAVEADAPEGSQCYAVFCHGRGDFAEGGSMPIIIVYPK